MKRLARNPPPRRVLAALVLVAVMALAGTEQARPSTPRLAGTLSAGSFHSVALKGVIRYSVYLPPGYAGSSTRRYPVIYFLHGLPGEANAYRSIGWFAQALERSGRRAIVIGAKGARAGDTDPEWRNWGAGRDWESAVSHELVSVVDNRYRTIVTAAGRALIGISAGGYGAALIGAHNPGIFSVAQSWSGYFEPTDPAGTAVLKLGSSRANNWASLHTLVPKLRGRANHFDFFVGADDTRFLSDNRRLARELSAHGVRSWTFRTYAGGHSLSLWSAHATAWISRALAETGSPT